MVLNLWQYIKKGSVRQYVYILSLFPGIKYGPYLKPGDVCGDSWVLTWNKPTSSAPKRKQKRASGRWGERRAVEACDSMSVWQEAAQLKRWEIERAHLKASTFRDTGECFKLACCIIAQSSVVLPFFFFFFCWGTRPAGWENSHSQHDSCSLFFFSYSVCFWITGHNYKLVVLNVSASDPVDTYQIQVLLHSKCNLTKKITRMFDHNLPPALTSTPRTQSSSLLGYIWP